MTIPTPVSGRLRPASTRFTLSSEERRQGAAAAFFGAPLDATGSFRPGMGAGPGAVRRLSDHIETYSTALDADLEDLVLVDLADLDLDDAEPQWGGLSGCTFEEAISWGKIDAEEARRAVCYCDVTIALPILAPRAARKGRRADGSTDLRPAARLTTDAVRVMVPFELSA